MGSYHVKEATKVKEVEGKFGPLAIYSLALVPSEGGEQINAELAQKPSTPAPSVGQVLEGDVEQGPFGAKFKKQRAGAFGGRPEDPERSRRIGRMHAQEMSLRYCQLKQMRGELPDDFKVGPQLERIIDWFEADTDRKGEPARPSDVPSDVPWGQAA